MANIGIGELRSNPVADQCLKCFALYIKSIVLSKMHSNEAILFFL